MEYKPNIVYELMANALTVVSVAHPIKITFHPDDDLLSAWEEFMNYDIAEDWCALILDNQHIYGYLTFDDPIWELSSDEEMKGCVRDKLHPIGPELIVPATLPLLDLVPLFQESWFFFVLAANEITHVVSFNDMDGLPLQFSLFSLLMELESQIIHLLGRNTGDLRDYLNLLSTSRIEKATSLCKLKYEDKITPVHLLLCTTFIDKKEMIVKSSLMEDQTLFSSSKKLSNFFIKTEKIRNQIAHSDSVLKHLRLPKDMVHFIDTLKYLINYVYEKGIT